MNCPCEKCLCLSTCKHKHIHKLFRECSLIKEYEPDYYMINLRDKDRLFYLQKIMRSTVWEFRFIPGGEYTALFYKGFYEE